MAAINSTVPQIQLALLDITRAVERGEPSSPFDVTLPVDPDTKHLDPSPIATAACALIRHLAHELADARDTTAEDVLESIWLSLRVDVIGGEDDI